MIFACAFCTYLSIEMQNKFNIDAAVVKIIVVNLPINISVLTSIDFLLNKSFCIQFRITLKSEKPLPQTKKNPSQLNSKPVGRKSLFNKPTSQSPQKKKQRYLTKQAYFTEANLGLTKNTPW